MGRDLQQAACNFEYHFLVRAFGHRHFLCAVAHRVDTSTPPGKELAPASRIGVVVLLPDAGKPRPFVSRNVCRRRQSRLAHRLDEIKLRPHRVAL